MNHYLSAYDKITDELVFQLEIPQTHAAQLSQLMGWTTEEEKIHVYDLDGQHLQAIAAMLGQNLASEHYCFQLDCFA